MERMYCMDVTKEFITVDQMHLQYRYANLTSFTDSPSRLAGFYQSHKHKCNNLLWFVNVAVYFNQDHIQRVSRNVLEDPLK